MYKISLITLTSLAILCAGAYLVKASDTSLMPTSQDVTKMHDVEQLFPGNKGFESRFRVRTKDDLKMKDTALKHLVKAEIKNYSDAAVPGHKLKYIAPDRQVWVTTEDYHDGTSFKVLGTTYNAGIRTVVIDAETGRILKIRTTYALSDVINQRHAPLSIASSPNDNGSISTLKPFFLKPTLSK